MTDTTNVDVTPDADEPIPALLPRDWPAQLTEFMNNLAAPVPPAVQQAALALVDGWVQAAADAVGEVEAEIEAEVMEELAELSGDDTGDPSDD